MLIVNVHTDKRLDCDLQRTDPACCQRECPTDRTTNFLKEKQYLIKHPQSGLDTKTYWLTVSCKVTVTVELTCHLNCSVSMSWYRAPLWDLRPNIISCQNVAVWNLRSCIYGTPSLMRGQVCNLQCNHSIVLVAQNPKPYFTKNTFFGLRSEVTLRLTVSQSVSMSWHRAHLGTCGQIFYGAVLYICPHCSVSR
jgi:hypothetical protein